MITLSNILIIILLMTILRFILESVTFALAPFEILGQNPPDKTPRTKPSGQYPAGQNTRWTNPPPPPWTKPPWTKPTGQTPPPPPEQNPPDNLPPPDKTPRTKPPGQNPPRQNPTDKTPGQTTPDKSLGENPPGKTPPPSQNPVQNNPNINHHRKTTQNKPQTPNKAPRGQKPGKILDGVHFKFRWLQSSISNMMNGKLYVYIQLQMRYLIASGST